MHNELFQVDDDSYVDGPEISCYNTGMLILITTTNSTQFTASQRTSSYNLILSYMAPKHIFVPSEQVASDIILKMYNYRYHHGGRNNLLWSSYCAWPQFYERHETLIRLVFFERNKIAAAMKKKNLALGLLVLTH
jgi:hypothetical protein